MVGSSLKFEEVAEFLSFMRDIGSKISHQVHLLYGQDKKMNNFGTLRFQENLPQYCSSLKQAYLQLYDELSLGRAGFTKEKRDLQSRIAS